MTALTKVEAAERLAVSLSTVNRMLRDGDLTKRKIRGAVRIDPAEVDALITGRKPRRKTPARVIDLTA